MKKIVTLAILAALFIPSISFAAMNPDLKECMQRGYEVEYTQGESVNCILPDDRKCTLENFNADLCGLEYKSKAYCVAEGLPVWDKNKCCPGTVPDTYQISQATCTHLSTTQTISSQIILNLPTILFSGATIIFLSVILAILRKKRKN